MKTEKTVAVLVGVAVFLGFCAFQQNPFGNTGHVVGNVLFSVVWATVVYAALDKNFRRRWL